MKIDIFDYKGRKATVDIGDLNDILNMHIFVLCTSLFLVEMRF